MASSNSHHLPAGSGGMDISDDFWSDEFLADAAVSAAPGSGGGPQSDAGGSAGKERRRKQIAQSWTTVSCAPYDDGFQWRKYGEKKISKTKFARSYFRCSYRDEDGCLATKQVQQKEMEDPPLFLVTYCNEHTCSYRNSLFVSNEEK